MNIASVIAAGQAQEEERERAGRAGKQKRDTAFPYVGREGEAIREKKENTFLDMFKAHLDPNGEAAERSALRRAGLPSEIAGKTIEEALVFLKDRVTMAGDELLDKMTDRAFNDYRQAVKQFTRFVLKNTLDIEKRQSSARRRRRTVYTQIEVVDKKLNEIAAQIFLNQRDKFVIMNKTEEIAGLIVDMMF